MNINKGDLMPLNFKSLDWVQIGVMREFKPTFISKLDTRGLKYCMNVCMWHDGSIVPIKGHNGNCKWLYDGQVFYHIKEEL